MRLVNCYGCGVVLDADKLVFPQDLFGEDDSIDEDKASWNGYNWVAKVQCPVCNGDIMEPK